jgi:high affinity sulfate transporter 1
VSLLLPSLRGYSRAWLGADLLAGLTLAAVCVPESMADAKLAAMPPVTGLYAFLAGALGALLFSTSRQLSVGPDSTIAPMMAVGVGSVVAAAGPDYASRIVLLALIVGVVVLAAGVARLGFLADLLSRPVMSGFLSGVGITVVVGQLHVLLGLPGTSGATLEKLAAVVQHLGETNVATLAVGVAVLVVLVGGERLGPRFPGALVAVGGSLAAVAVFELAGRGVALVGSLPPGLPALVLPSATLADVTALVPVVIPVFFVILAQTAATSRSFAVAGGYEVRVDRDFLAVGAACMLASVTGGFAVNASPTRTGVVAASNGRSQAVNLTAGVLVAAVLLVATGLIARLPEATLGGILVAVGVKLVKWRDLAAVARYSRPEWAIALATLLVVALVGIQEGIYLAIALALLRRIYLSARPHDVVLGRLAGPDGVWVSRRHRPDAAALPGVVVFRFDAPLFYANAQHFADRIRAVMGEAPVPVHTFVVEAVGIDDLDFTGMHILAELDAALRAREVTLVIAHPFGRLGTELASGSLAQRFAGRVFNSVDDAVAASQTGGSPRAGEDIPKR